MSSFVALARGDGQQDLLRSSVLAIKPPIATAADRRRCSSGSLDSKGRSKPLRRKPLRARLGRKAGAKYVRSIGWYGKERLMRSELPAVNGFGVN